MNNISVSTGSFENWAGTITDIGPIYPFVGSEGVLVFVGIALWIVWHIIQAKRENQVYQDEIKRFGGADALKRMVASEDPRNP